MQEIQTTLPIGSVIRNRYSVEGLLGKGGFGAVYLVRDLRVRGNLYALKELIDSSKQERIRFTFEGEVLKRLDHPALPRVYRAFEDEKNARAYMLMDYIEGPNLEKLRQQQPGKRFPLADVLHMLAPIFSAASYLHSQQPPIIHRDIKPANLIVPPEGDGAMLVDFGIAKEYDPDSTTTAIRRCSPGYGAPEQYSHGTNTRTDLYGLAATIYALLTGEVPADAFYRMTQTGSRGVDTLVPVHDLVPSIPRSISQAIQRAMALDTADRYSSVDEFWQALQGYPALGETTEPELAQGHRYAAALPLADPATMSPAPAHGQHIENVTTRIIPVQTQTKTQKRRGLLLLLPLLALLLIASVALATFWPAIFGHFLTSPTSTPIVAHHQKTPAISSPTARPTARPSPKPTPSATARPTPSPSATAIPTPSLLGAHNGQVHNVLGGEITGMTLNVTQQFSHSINGNVVISPPLLGSGPIIYSSLNNSSIIFTVQGYHGNNPLYFYGTVNNDGSMSGSYCSVDPKTHQCSNNAGGYGTWNVGPSSSPSSQSFAPGIALPQATILPEMPSAQRN